MKGVSRISDLDENDLAACTHCPGSALPPPDALSAEEHLFQLFLSVVEDRGLDDVLGGHRNVRS